VNDYYGILGVPRDASADQIKRAYRRACRETHPDVAGSSEANERRIKEVNAAYQVLSDPSKREAYDLGVDPLAPGGGGGASGGNPFGGAGFGSFQDLFETMFAAATGGGAAPRPASRRARGRDQLEALTIDLEDAVFGATKQIVIPTFVGCLQCGGSGAADGATPVMCQACGGRGVRERVVRSLFGDMRTAEPCPACSGFGTRMDSPCSGCSGAGRVRSRETIDVDVPAGVDTGTRLRLMGQGEAGQCGGPAGDLYLELRVRSHPEFTRDGDHLRATIRIPMTAAALGAQLNINTLDGAKPLDVPAGTQPGDVLRLQGLGAGRVRGSGRGDLLVTVEVRIPSRLDAEQRDLLQNLAQSLDDGDQSEPLPLERSGSVFSKIRDKLAGR
jgi:molecular chaperone DnaJ